MAQVRKNAANAPNEPTVPLNTIIVYDTVIIIIVINIVTQNEPVSPTQWQMLNFMFRYDRQTCCIHNTYIFCLELMLKKFFFV